MTYIQNISKIQKIINKINESPENVSENLKLFREAVEIIRNCEEKLDIIQKKIKTTNKG